MTSDVIKGGKLLNRLSEYQLLKTVSLSVRVEKLALPVVLATFRIQSPRDDLLL
jgi:hypothetical protein